MSHATGAKKQNFALVVIPFILFPKRSFTITKIHPLPLNGSCDARYRETSSSNNGLRGRWHSVDEKSIPLTPVLLSSLTIDGHREVWGWSQPADEEVYWDEETLHWHIGNPWVIIPISCVVLPRETDGPEACCFVEISLLNCFSAYLDKANLEKKGRV